MEGKGGGSTQSFPVSDRGFFETFVQKMGWKATQDSLMKKVSQHVAVL
jgi:hypothetical protein